MIDIAVVLVIFMLIVCVVFLIVPVGASICGWIVLLGYASRDALIWTIRRYYQWKNS